MATLNSAELRAPAWQAPARWPAGARAGPAESAYTERLLALGLVFAMLAISVLDRFGLRLTASFSVPPAMMAMYGLVFLMLLTGSAALNVRGALGYLALAVLAGLSLLLNAAYEPPAYVSVLSFLLLLAFYAPFVVTLGEGSAGPRLWRWTVNLYIAFGVLLAVAGVAQFALQFVYRGPLLFDYTALIPEPLRTNAGWNTVYAMSGWIKSNGFFMREPSIFSIAMALAAICELNMRRRKWVMAVLLAGLLLSYSGSGLLCLAAALLFPLGLRTIVRLITGAALAAAVYFSFGETLNLDYTLGRADELKDSRSSAYCRFVYPVEAVVERMASTPWAGVLGHGPGSMDRMGATCENQHQPTLAKAAFEYGLAGTLAVGALLLGALNRSAAPLQMRVGLGVAWLFLGGNLLASELLLLIFVFSAMWPPRTGLEATRAA